MFAQTPSVHQGDGPALSLLFRRIQLGEREVSVASSSLGLQQVPVLGNPFPFVSLQGSTLFPLRVLVLHKEVFWCGFFFPFALCPYLFPGDYTVALCSLLNAKALQPFPF